MVRATLQPAWQHFRRPWCQALLAGLAGLLLTLTTFGYTSNENAQHFQFRPWLEAKLDPSLYPRDVYVPTVDHIPSYFWSGSAWILSATGWDPDVYFFALYLLSLTGLYTMLFLLARETTRSFRAGWLTIGLALLCVHLHSNSLLAHDNLFRNLADQTLWTWPILLGVLTLWIRGRKSVAFALAGVGFNFNPFFSASTVFCVLVAESLGRHGPGRSHWLRSLRLFGIFLAVASPTWIAILRMPPPSISSADWAELLRLWFPFHYFPTAWPPAQWLYILGHGGTLALLYYLGLSRLSRRPELLRFGIGLLVLWTGYVFFSEVVPFRPLILFQALRMDVLATVLALIGAGAVLDRLLALGPAGWAWFGLLWVALGNPHRTFLPTPLFLPVLAWWAVVPAAFGQVSGWVAPYLAAMGVLSLLRLMKGFSLSVFYPMESAVLVVLFSVLLLWRWPRRWHAVAAGLAVVVSFGELATARNLHRKSVEKKFDLQEKRRLMAWLQEHTPKEALVLSLPYFHDLRLGSRRSFVAQFIDGAAMHWEPDFGPLWKERMEDLGYLFERTKNWPQLVALERFPLLRRAEARAPVVMAWNRERLARMLTRYRPDYVVAPLNLNVPWVRREVNTGRFVIYRVIRRPASDQIPGLQTDDGRGLFE